MPDINDIKKFNEILKSLASEQKILDQRGESIEDVPIASEGLPDDLSALLGTADIPGEISADALDINAPDPGEEEMNHLDNIEDFLMPPIDSAEEEPGISSLDEFSQVVESGNLAAQPEISTADLMPDLSASDLPADFLPGDLTPDSTPADLPDEFLTDNPSSDLESPDLPIDFLPSDLESDATPPDLPADFLPDDLTSESTPSDLPSDFSSGEDSFPQETLPEDLLLPSDDGGLPDEFAVPDIGGTEPTAEESTEKIGSEFEMDLVDDFSMPDEPDHKPPKRDEIVIDEFNLPGMDEDLSIDTLDEGFGGGEIAPEKIKPSRKKESSARKGEFQLSDKEFTNLQLTLESLPRNLKIVVQDVIAAEQIPQGPLKALIDLLVKGASPTRIAEFISKETGQRIELPKRFEKKTGVEFDRERRTFSYMFRENIIPMLKVLIPAVILLAIVIIGVIRLIVIPWNAGNLYKKGLMYILKENKFNLGDDTFNEAYKIYPEKKWFYRYAEAYAEKKEYKLAELKYEQLLNLRWKNSDIEFLTNLDEKGIVDYAKFESKRFNFAKAEKLLNFLLDRQKFNKAALFAAGDNYLEWAKSDNSKYELARLSYAKLQRTNADRKELDFRFLRYFIRVDNPTEVQRLMDYYQKNTGEKVDPYVYTELGGYLLAKNKIDDVKAVLYRAKAVKEDIPELHFHLSTYFHLIGKAGDEETALIKTLNYFTAAAPLSTEQREMNIEAHNRLGKLYFSQDKIFEAENEYLTAKTIIEDGQKNSTLGKKPALGEVYYNLGNIYYYDIMDYNSADDNFIKALDNYYQNPELYYKKGFISYNKKDYLDALLYFYKAEDEIRENPNLLLAIANTLYYRNDFYAAQGYYLHLLDLLDQMKNNIPSLDPKGNPEHLALLNIIMRAYNNLAVTLALLAQKPRNPARETEALVYLTKSSEYYDMLKRLLLTPTTLERDKETRNVAYLNQRKILYEQAEFPLALYYENPVDTETGKFKDDWFSLEMK